jgi:hypothetical protein
MLFHEVKRQNVRCLFDQKSSEPTLKALVQQSLLVVCVLVVEIKRSCALEENRTKARART